MAVKCGVFMIAIFLLVGWPHLSDPLEASEIRCPEPTQQVAKDVKIAIEGKAAALGKLGAAELKNQTEVATKDLWEKAKNLDRVLIANSLISMTCQVIKNSKTLSDDEKLNRIEKLINEINSLLSATTTKESEKKSDTNKSQSKKPSKQTKPKSTAQDKLGIWVARLSGDKANFSAQHGVIQELEQFIGQNEDDEEMRKLLEVRELPEEIRANTTEEKTKQIEKLGRQYNAAMIVWGEIAGFKVDKLFLKVTITRPTPLKRSTLPLQPISEDTIRNEERLSPPPKTIERINQPFQLARLIVALSLLDQKKWDRASHQLKQFIEQYLRKEGSPDTNSPDVYALAGYIELYFRKDDPTTLSRGHTYLLEASRQYKKAEDAEKYASIQVSLGASYRRLAERGEDPKQNFKHSEEILQEATNLINKHKHWDKYGGALINLALTYWSAARHGQEPEQNLKRSAARFEEAIRLWDKEGTRAEYAEAALVIADAHVHIFFSQGQGIEDYHNLETAVDLFEKAIPIVKKEYSEPGLASINEKLGIALYLLARGGNQPEQNFRAAIKVQEEAVILRKHQQHEPFYASLLDSLAKSYRALGDAGMEPVENYKHAIKAWDEARRLMKELNRMHEFADYQAELGRTYRYLGLKSKNPENFREAIRAIDDALPFLKQGDWKKYADLQEEAARAYIMLATLDIEHEQNTNHAIKAYLEAGHEWKEHQDLKKYGDVQQAVGSFYSFLAYSGVDPDQNLESSVDFLQEASRLHKDNHKSAYAKDQELLATACLFLVKKEVDRSKNIQCALDASHNRLVINPHDAEAYAIEFSIYQELLFSFLKAFDLIQQWLERHPNDLSAQANFAEAHFTTGRFAEAETRVAAVIAKSELPPEAGLGLRAVQIATLLAVNKTEAVASDLEALRSFVASQTETFESRWSFKGTKHFITEDERFALYRDWLFKLLTGLEGKKRDDMLAAIDSARSAWLAAGRRTSDLGSGLSNDLLPTPLLFSPASLSSYNQALEHRR